MKHKEQLLKGKESTLFFKYIFPSVFGMVGMSLYIFADTYFIANGIGSIGLTALNVAIPLFSILTGLGLLIGIGGGTIFSIAKGSGDLKRQNESFSIALSLGIVCGIIITIVGILFSRQISLALGASEQVIDLVNVYVKTIFVFSIAFITNHIIAAFVRNDGAPKLAMIAMLLSTLANIVMDYILIYPLDLGIFGAAAATAVSPVVSIAILLLHFILKNNSFKYRRIKPKIKDILEVVKGGISSCITELCSGIVIFIFNIVILNLKGDIGVAAYGIISNVALIAIAVFNGLCQGIQPLISINYGAEKYDRLKNFVKYGIVTSLILGLMFYAVGFFYPYEITMLFNSENIKELTDLTVRGIGIYFISLIIMGVNMTIIMILQSISRAKEALILSLSRGFFAILIGLIILPQLFGLDGVWITAIFAEVVTLLIAVVIVKNKKIKKEIQK